jgi:cytochrome c biogenesis protein CcmG/thiol:disulfide interchange protein DsbE
VNSPSVPPRPGSAAAKQQQKSKQSAPQFKKAAKPSSSSETGGGNPLANPWVLGGIVAVVVLVLGLVAILSTTGGKDDDGDFAQNRPVTVAGTALPAEPSDGSDDPSIGLIAPEVSGQNFEGIDVSIGHGAPTLVVFLAHWCPHCQAEVPLLVQWNNDKQVPAGLRVVGIATSTDERRENYPPSDWLAREGFPWPVLADSADLDAAAAYGVTGFPTFLLFDADGTVLWRTSGELPIEQLNATLAEKLAG